MKSHGCDCFSFSRFLLKILIGWVSGGGLCQSVSLNQSDNGNLPWSNEVYIVLFRGFMREEDA